MKECLKGNSGGLALSGGRDYLAIYVETLWGFGHNVSLVQGGEQENQYSFDLNS